MGKQMVRCPRDACVAPLSAMIHLLSGAAWLMAVLACHVSMAPPLPTKSVTVRGFLFRLERLPEPLECGVDCNHCLGGTASPVRVVQHGHLAVAPVDPLFDPSLGIVRVVLTSCTQSQPSLDGGPQARVPVQVDRAQDPAKVLGRYLLERRTPVLAERYRYHRRHLPPRGRDTAPVPTGEADGGAGRGGSGRRA